MEDAHFCGQCGHSHEVGAAFCAECGSPTTPADQPSSITQAQVHNPAPSTWVRVGIASTIAVVALGAIALGVRVLRPDTPSPAQASESATPTASANPQPAPVRTPVAPVPVAQSPANPASGSPIRTLKVGTPARTQMMNAARTLLGESRQFVVGQLNIQDGYAIAELTPKGSEDTWIVAFSGSDGAWNGIWSGRHDSRNALAEAQPDLPSTLLDSIVWAPLGGEPSESEILAATKRYAADNAGVSERLIDVSVGKTVLGPDGTWWITSGAEMEQYDPITLVMHVTPGTRSLVLDDLGTAVIDDRPSYMPRSVWEKLCR